MTNTQMRSALMHFQAKKFACDADDFLGNANKVYINESDSECFFRMLCFGDAAIVRANEKIYNWCVEFVPKYTGFRCFDGVEMSLICRELSKYDYTVSCGQGAMPDVSRVRPKDESALKTKIYSKGEIKHFYSEEIDSGDWHMLYYSDETEYIVAKYDGDKVVGFATSDRCTKDIYDVGYEVLPEYRQKGIATALTIRLTDLLLDQNIIPFATFAWSNIASKNVLFKSGYLLAWSSMSACDREYAMKVAKGEAE